MKILLATSEAFPYAKTGGLADVASALPQALARNGHQVSVIMPCYPQVFRDKYSQLSVAIEKLGVPFAYGETKWCKVLKEEINDNLTFYFVEYHTFFDRPTLYDYHGEEYGDNAARYCFLSRAVMEIAIALDLKPDVLHTNDWHTALCNVYLKSKLYSNSETFEQTKSLITIHNIGYQGIFHKDNMINTGLDWDYFNPSCLEYHDQINFLKGGIMCADRVNTVSPSYASEILLPEYAFDLEGPLQHIDYLGRLSGILNGIDTDEWNPKTDPKIPANYSIEKMEGKAICKAALQKQFGLPQNPETPLFGVISRLATQKGLDVFAYCIDLFLIHDDIQFVLLGSGDKTLEARFNKLAELYPNKFACYIGYNDQVSHLVEAGSDFFVMPSRYEPCGLNQMYSMIYGTVPIVRGTGGLEDTVTDCDAEPIANATGFKFYDLTGDVLSESIGRAMRLYQNAPENYKIVQRNGMTKNFSWEHTANQYEALYLDL
jgi:starch synthase